MSERGRFFFTLFCCSAVFCCSPSPPNTATPPAPSSPVTTPTPATGTVENSAPSTPPPPAVDPELIKRGQRVYRANCIACHNMDPRKNGSLGPDLAGSALELLQMRVLTVGYPAGYTPKRKTKSMTALPHLKKDIPALHAYLNSF